MLVSSTVLVHQLVPSAQEVSQHQVQRVHRFVFTIFCQRRRMDSDFTTYTTTAQSIQTRCSCDNDATMNSTPSVAVVTAPATCTNVPSAPNLSIVNNVFPSLIGSITTGCGTGTVVEYAPAAAGPYTTIAPTYTTSPITVYARCRNTTTGCVSPSVNGTTAPVSSTTVLTLNCPTTITVTAAANATTAVANYTAPTGTSTCTTGSVVVTKTSGLASGSAFPIGMSTIC